MTERELLDEESIYSSDAHSSNTTALAKFAYAVADAMLTERKKRDGL